MFKLVLTAILLLTAQSAQADALVKGFNLTEAENFPYDAAADGQPKTPAQDAVDQAFRLGSNHIILNVRATMKGPFANEITPVTPPAERANEARRMARLIRYIKAKGMTVGLRPIFFVVGPNGEFPYSEKQADGTNKVWWHGNIQPSDPNRWFESFRVYLDVYLTIAKALKVEEFTVGAELYSMTVGLEDQWKEYPYGFPGRWLELLRYVRSKLPTARLMYDINFTDEKVSSPDFTVQGGELERWRYRLVDLADPANPEEKQIWEDLASFWKELDAVGVDMYRSLAGPNDALPSEYEALVDHLRQRADSFASQLDSTLSAVELTLGVQKPAILKEIGYRSVDRGFIDPFAYAGTGTMNEQHQAAAFDAIYRSFWEARWPWFAGLNWWEIQVDPSRSGPRDTGFSPVSKQQTEDVILKYWR
jgi:sugar phosphate isomerase/epimerase